MYRFEFNPAMFHHLSSSSKAACVTLPRLNDDLHYAFHLVSELEGEGEGEALQQQQQQQQQQGGGDGHQHHHHQHGRGVTEL